MAVTLLQLCEAWLSSRDETFRAAIDRGNAWLKAAAEAGHADSIEEEFPRCDVAVRVVGEPLSEGELAAVERELGCRLPPSYRAFLGEIGAVAFLNPWWDETTPKARLVSSSQRLTNPDCDFDWRQDSRWASLSPAPLIRVSDHHNGDDWFYVMAARDEAGEAPLVLGFHDGPQLQFASGLDRPAPEGHDRFERWLSAQVNRTIQFVTEKTTKAQARRGA